jgi:mono/diheme cytochrome c family protein
MLKKIYCSMYRSLQLESTGVLRAGITLMFGFGLAGVLASSSAIASPGYRSQKTGEASAEAIYKRHCSVCHGDRGTGNSRVSRDLNPPPRNFNEATNLSREHMIYTVTNGKPGTAMMGWKNRFTENEISSVVDYVRGRFMLVALDKHIALGRGVYGHFCQVCHGDRGQGEMSAEMQGMPRDLTTPQAQAGLTRERLLESITRGQHGPIKTGFSEKLNAEYISAVTDYIRRVMLPDLSKGDAAPAAAAPAPASSPAAPVTQSSPASAIADMSQPLPKGLVGNPKLGEKFFMGNCSTCHGKNGDAQGPRAYFINNPGVRSFRDEYSHTVLNRPAIFKSVTLGRPGTEMPAWGHVLSEQEVANVTEFVFQTFISQPVIPSKASGK